MPLPLRDWLIRPLMLPRTADGRLVRSNLLAWLLLSTFLLTIVALVVLLLVDPANTPRRVEYLPFIVTLSVLIALAYFLNCAGSYRAAAGLTVACAVAGPWGSLAIDPTVAQGDVMPLAYVLLSILLASLLLSPVVTSILAAIQIVALALVAALDPFIASLNWPSLISLVFFASVLSILASMVVDRNFKQVEQQARALVRSEAELRELSVRDHLTQLFNRRYLEESLEREIRRSARSRYPIGVILIDVDHFKEINDRSGHGQGDAILQGIAQVALKHIRGGDIACRYGGDELVVVIPDAPRRAVLERAEQLREAVRQLHLEYGLQKQAIVAISVGVAMYPDHGSTGQQVLESADRALYLAKYMGRDRVVCAD